MVKILVKKFGKNFKLPTYKTSGSSGMDLMAYLKKKIKVNAGKKITHSQNYAAKTVSNLHNKNVSFLRFIDHPITLSLVNSFLKQGSFMNSGKIICKSPVSKSSLKP